MAEAAESADSPDAVGWLRRIADLSPTTANRLKLASAATRWEGFPYTCTRRVVNELAASSEELTEFHVIAAELALKLHNATEAAAHFRKAVLLEPTNELHQFNLAVLTLRGSVQDRRPATDDESECADLLLSPEEVATAHSTLERFAGTSRFGLLALRSLIGDALARKQFAAAEGYSNHLLVQPGSLVDDQLRHLDILEQLKQPEFNRFLLELQRCGATNSRAIYAISSWMLAHAMVDEALHWLTRLEPSIRSQQPVPLALAEAYIAAGDWAALERLLTGAGWGELEFLRLATLSRVAWEQKRREAATSFWRLAIRSAPERLEPMKSLVMLARHCGQDREELLWNIAFHFPRERWSLRQLIESYAATGNTSGLNRVYSRWMTLEPENFVAKNNFTATALLLKVNLSKAHELARELYGQTPHDPVIASTYAYSLHLQARTKEGLQILQRYDPKALATPALALYYGLLLAADQQTNKAGQYLQAARTAQLLPEERVLAESVGQL